MKSINSNQTQLKTLFFGLLCLLAGVVCFAKGYSSPSNSATAAITSGERQGVSPPCRCSVADDTFQPQFTSLTPRYVTKRIADLEVGEEVVAKDPESGEVTTKRVANVFRKVSDHLRILQVRNPLTNELQTIETTDDHPFWVAVDHRHLVADPGTPSRIASCGARRQNCGRKCQQRCEGDQQGLDGHCFRFDTSSQWIQAGQRHVRKNRTLSKRQLRRVGRLLI